MFFSFLDVPSGNTATGDTSKIKIGSETSIGDRAVINVPDFKLRVKQEFPDTVIGNRVTIGISKFLYDFMAKSTKKIIDSNIAREFLAFMRNIVSPSSVDHATYF